MRWAWKHLKTAHRPEPQLAVIAYGKLGGKELGYGSDLDVVFVYDDAETEPDKAAEVYGAFVRKLITWLTMRTAAGELFDIDTALRPNGNSGLLVTSMASFENYQTGRGSNTAWTWEHQALTRARWCAGIARLAPRFEAVRRAVLAAPRDLQALLDEVRAMREKVRAAHPVKAGRFDVKHSPGGMIDVEFAVQALVLGHGADRAELLDDVGNIALLRRAEAAGLLPAGVGAAAADAYRDLRRAQHRARLDEQPTQVEPARWPSRAAPSSPSGVRSSADGGRAWCALAAVLAVGAALGVRPRAARRSTGSRRSRCASRGARSSAAFVHYSALHLLANLAGVAAGRRARRVRARAVRRSPLAWLLAWPLTQLGLLARPDLLHYGGLSGVLHAGVACVAVHLIVHARGPRRAIGALLLAALAIKVVSEAPWGPALRHPAGWDIATAPFAHASGLVAGVIAALLVEATTRCASTSEKGLRRSPPLPLGGRGAKRGGSDPAAIAAMTRAQGRPSRRPRRRPPRPLLLSLGPEPGRREGGAARDSGALAGDAALGRRGDPGLALGAVDAASRCSRATARSTAACSPARCSPPSSSASSSACSSRPRRAWSSSSTSRPSSSPSACR